MSLDSFFDGSETHPMQNLSDFLLKLPVQIDDEDSKKLVSFVRDFGFPMAMYVDGQRKFIWKSHLFRTLSRGEIPAEVVEESRAEWRSLDFVLRNRIDLNWVWDESRNSADATSIVKKVIERLSPYILKLGRVQILLQRPALGVPLHSDLMPGSSYDGVVYKPISSIEVGKVDLHARNKNFAIKVPLTEREGDNGYPTIEVEGQTLVYDVGSNAFVIDEHLVRHGSLPCGHWRGVLVIDAELNLERILSDARPVKATNRTYDRVYRRVMQVRREDLNAIFPGQSEDSLDIRLIVGDYIVMRLKSPEFLGVCIRLSPDGLTLTGNTYWTGEAEQNSFFLQNEVFIHEMATIFNVLSAQRGISISRSGEWVNVADLPEEDRRSIYDRDFIRLRETNS